MTSTPIHQSIKRIPKSLCYLRRSFLNLRRLKLRPTPHAASRDEALAEPIFRSLRFSIPKSVMKRRQLFEHLLDCWSLRDLWNHADHTWWTPADLLDFASANDVKDPPSARTMSRLLRKIMHAVPAQLVNSIEQPKISPLEHLDKKDTTLYASVAPGFHDLPEVVRIDKDISDPSAFLATPTGCTGGP